MSRKLRELSLQTEERWPHLVQFLRCYFGEGVVSEFGSVEAALDQAIFDWDLPGRQKVLREWRDWNNEWGWRKDVIAAVNNGLGADLWFELGGDARNFMNKVYDKLITSVRAETHGSWKA